MTSDFSLATASLPGTASAEIDTSAYLPSPAIASQQTTSVVIAQNFDQDVIGDFGNALNNFIESGQVWALLIGFLLGYLLRGVTTYK
jgi:hypothetical protein